MGMNRKKKEPCKFNTQCMVVHEGTTFPREVDCERGVCATCGWNPAVEAQRKKDIRAALLPVVSRWVIGRGSFETVEKLKCR